MEIKTPTGMLLDDQEAFAPSLNKHAQRIGLGSFRIFVGTDQNGTKEYVLYDAEEPVYATQQAESMGCHLDMIAKASEAPAHD